MKAKEEISGISIVIGIVCLVLAVAGAASIHNILSHINGWQALAYVIVGGIFIALIAVIVNSILSFYLHK